MNDKALELLTQLADKFGTTAEHLWGVMVKQAAISAITDCVIASILLAAWIWMVLFVRVKTSEVRAKCGDVIAPAQWNEKGAFFAWATVAVAALVVTISVSCAGYDAATALLNPEYWALRQIIR